MVGVYLNSSDLPGGSPEFKFMITPQFTIPKTARQFPFAKKDAVVEMSLELQVPVAVNANVKGTILMRTPCFYFLTGRAKPG